MEKRGKTLVGIREKRATSTSMDLKTSFRRFFLVL